MNSPPLHTAFRPVADNSTEYHPELSEPENQAGEEFLAGGEQFDIESDVSGLHMKVNRPTMRTMIDRVNVTSVTERTMVYPPEMNGRAVLIDTGLVKLWAEKAQSLSPDLWLERITYKDPTATSAIKWAVEVGGPFTITAQNRFRARADLATMLVMLAPLVAVRKRGRVKNGRRLPGNTWLEFPQEKNNPDAVAKFGDSDSTGVHTETIN